MRKFTEDEIQYIRDNYLSKSDVEIAKELDRSESSIKTKRVKMKLVRKEINILSDVEKKNIIYDYLNGMKLKDISTKYNKPSSNIITFLQRRDMFKNKNNRWTQNEIDILREYYGYCDWNYLFQLLPNRQRDDIIHKAYKLQIKRKNYYWTKEEISILKDGYNDKLPIEYIKSNLNNKFTYGAIATKAYKIGIIKDHWWTEWEIEYLKNNYEFKPLDELAIVLKNREKYSIIAMAGKLGLIALRTYKQYEIDFIKNNWKTMSDKEMSKYINRSYKNIINKRISLGLIRPIPIVTCDNLNKYLRLFLKQWRNDSIVECNNQCAITGEKYNAVHHLYAMNLIIDEAFSELEMCEKESFSDYTKTELNILIDKIKEIHRRYPLGVCLKNEIHNLFHFLYGYGNNTPEQFEKFKQRYFAGEFNKVA